MTKDNPFTNGFSNSSLQEDRINDIFMDACKNGDMQRVREMLSSKEVARWVNIHSMSEVGLRMACSRGDLEMVRFLLTSPEITAIGARHCDIHCLEDKPLQEACEYGHLDVVRYLVTSPEITAAGQTNSNIHARHDAALRLACFAGQLEVVKYLLASPEITASGQTHAHIDAHDPTCDDELLLGFGSPLCFACGNGHLAVIKFLLTSPELKGRHANVHQHDDYALRCAVRTGQHEVVHYLIFDYHIDITPALENYMEENPALQSLFEQRQLREKLHVSLNEFVAQTTKKPKI